MPADYKILAHYHPVVEAVRVISGEFSVGMGDKRDMQKGMAVHPGGFAYAPALLPKISRRHSSIA